MLVISNYVNPSFLFFNVEYLMTSFYLVSLSNLSDIEINKYILIAK